MTQSTDLLVHRQPNHFLQLTSFMCLCDSLYAIVVSWQSQLCSLGLEID